MSAFQAPHSDPGVRAVIVLCHRQRRRYLAGQLGQFAAGDRLGHDQPPELPWPHGQQPVIKARPHSPAA